MHGQRRLTLLFGMAIIGGHHFVETQSFDIVPHEPHPQSAETTRHRSSSASSSSDEDTMWPYPTYKPISWERYYTRDLHDKGISLTSGIAAGITIGVFFAVFLLTFGCRLYSQRSESLRRFSARSTHSNRILAQRRLSVSDFFTTCPSPGPPPTYDVAIRMTPEGEPPQYSPRPSPDSSCSRGGSARPA